MAEDVEVGFYVWVAVGVIGSEPHPGEVDPGSFVQGGGEGVCPGVSSGGVGAPAAGVHSGVAVTGCVDVDGEKEDVVVIGNFACLSLKKVDRICESTFFRERPLGHLSFKFTCIMQIYTLFRASQILRG